MIELYGNRAQKVCFIGVEESVTERDAAVRSPSSLLKNSECRLLKKISDARRILVLVSVKT
jgi:hypothetical protein